MPASSRTYALCLPAGKTSLFLANEDTICKVSKDTISKNAVVPLSSGTIVYHKVRKGETFNSVAKKYGVSPSNLRRWNGKGRKSTLKVGQKLKVYLPASVAKEEEEPAAKDTTTVADSLTTTIDSTGSNEVKATQTKPAQTKASQPKTQQAVYHTVKKGEHLSMIAKKYGTTPQKLMKLNNLKSDVIRVGQKLRVK